MLFEDLYRLYSPRIYRVCLGYMGDAERARDLTQETFISVWQHLDSFRNESAIGTWIYRIAANKCLRQIEKEKRLPEMPFPEGYEVPDVPAANDREPQRLFLQQCIRELPEIERLIIGLYLEEEPQERIAEVLGLSPGNVRVKVHRIKEKLTQKFRDHGPF